MEYRVSTKKRDDPSGHGREQDQLPLQHYATGHIFLKKPRFIIRWGITILFVIMFLILVGCWFIRYPDIIQARAKLTSLNAPKVIVAQNAGKLIKLTVKNGERVQKEQILGFLESSAEAGQVLRLRTALDTLAFLLQNGPDYDSRKVLPERFDKLGELQPAYQTFMNGFLQYQTYLSKGFYQQKKSLLLRDRLNLALQQNHLNDQKRLVERDLALERETYRMHDTLAKDRVISALEYRNEESKLIGKELSVPQINNNIVANLSEQNAKSKEILELEGSMAQQKTIFAQALHTMGSLVTDWSRKYLFTAPIEGQVSFAGFLQENQQLSQGAPVFFIDPGNSRCYGEMLIPQHSFGKAAVGQTVLLKIYAYPSEEFGLLKGNIEFISTQPTDSGYLAKISLPQGLGTTYEKKLIYKEGLQAEGQIITQDKGLLERLFYNMLKLTQR